MDSERGKLRYTFSYTERLHKQKDFQQVMKCGRRLVHPALFIYAYKRSTTDQTRRLGLITSRKVGSAVLRNRIKRRLREIFRLHKHELKPGVDIIFILRPQAADMDFGQLESLVLSQLKTANMV